MSMWEHCFKLLLDSITCMIAQFTLKGKKTAGAQGTSIPLVQSSANGWFQTVL